MREARSGTMKRARRARKPGGRRARPAARESLAALPPVGERKFGMGGKRGRGDKE